MNLVVRNVWSRYRLFEIPFLVKLGGTADFIRPKRCLGCFLFWRNYVREIKNGC